MGGGRFVVLGLARARSPWFRAVAQWSNSASIPVEFVKCMSATELRAHLASGRPFSALLVDGGLAALDRDLFDEVRSLGCAVVVVDDVRVSRDWLSMGAGAVINPVFERKDLLDVLADHAVQINRGDRLAEPVSRPPAVHGATVAMVCGRGGTGASTVAIALAQGIGDDPAYGGMVLLADLALHADQAMLHDARDVVPGVQELVEAHRTAQPSRGDLHGFTFAMKERRYQFLLGLRQAQHWPALRPRAFAAAVESLARNWRAVVCDTDSDLEGEEDGGSVDVEERHLMARTVAARADVVFAVGTPGMKGVHSLVRVIDGLIGHGVPAGRIVPVVNRAPKGTPRRAELSSAIGQLLRSHPTAAELATPIFLPERRTDEALRDGVRLPASLTKPLAGAFAAITTRAPMARPADEPQRIKPGALGHWSPDISPEPA